MEQSHRQQLSTEEILAGRDNEEEMLCDGCTICQFQQQFSRKQKMKWRAWFCFKGTAQPKDIFKHSKLLLHRKGGSGGGLNSRELPVCSEFGYQYIRFSLWCIWYFEGHSFKRTWRRASHSDYSLQKYLKVTVRFILLLFNLGELLLSQTIDIDRGLSYFFEPWAQLFVSFLKVNLVRKCPSLRF